MILTDELLPATQHYTLLAIATALYTVTIVNRQRAAPKAFWFFLMGTMGLVPIVHMEMSVFEAMSRSWSWTNSSLLFHGIAIALVVPIALNLALGIRNNPPRKLRLEPTVRA